MSDEPRQTTEALVEALDWESFKDPRVLTEAFRVAVVDYIAHPLDADRKARVLLLSGAMAGNIGPRLEALHAALGEHEPNTACGCLGCRVRRYREEREHYRKERDEARAHLKTCTEALRKIALTECWEDHDAEGHVCPSRIARATLAELKGSL